MRRRKKRQVRVTHVSVTNRASQHDQISRSPPPSFPPIEREVASFPPPPPSLEEHHASLAVPPTGETEGKHPREADPDVMREIHDPAPLLRVIRAKCLDCSAGVEIEIQKCTAIGCALWPYRMASNPFRAPRELTPEQREAASQRLAALRLKQAEPVAEALKISDGNEPDAPEATLVPAEAGRAVEAAE
jgi:hypothetical protein